MFKVYGLTGGIGAGKSAAAEIFSKLGVPVLNADEISKEIMAGDPEARAAILARFGTVDRAELRSRIFEDAGAKRDLEAILHPRVRAKSAELIGQLARTPAGFALYESALLVETGRAGDFDGLIVVDAPVEVRRRRLLTREGITPEIADQILANQAADEKKRAAATWVIENAGTLVELEARIQELLPKLRSV